MASILDSGLAGIFSSIFTFLLIYAIIFGTLSWRKVFGEKGTGMQAMVAFFVAIIAAITPAMRAFVSLVTPWYVAMFLVIFFVLFIVTMFGKSPDKDFPALIGDSRVYSWIMIFVVLIFLLGLGFTLGPGLTSGSKAAPQPVQVAPGTDVIGYAEPGVLAPDYYGTGSTGSPTLGQPGSTATSDFGTNFTNTLFHPKVLGLMITFLIAAVAVYFLSQSSAVAGGGHH